MTLFTCLFMIFFVIVMLRFQSEVSSLSATSVKIIKSNQSDEVDSDYKVIDYNYYYDYEAIDKIPKYQNETPRYEDFSPAEPGKTKKPKKTTTTRATTTTSTQTTSTILSYTPSNNNNEYPSTQSTTTLGGNDEEPTTTEEITTTTTNEASTTSTPEVTTTTNPTTQSSSTTQSTSTSTDKVTINCREKVEELLAASQNAKKLSGNVCEVVKPYIGFNLTLGDIRTEVKVNIESLDRNMLLIYFPSHYKPFEGSSDELLSCIEIESESLTITDLSPSIAYLFCILYSGDKMVSPYQCQSFMVQKGTPWIFENQKEKLIVACIVGIVVMFTVGVAIAYATIFAFPMLLKGSDRVIIVKKELRSISNKLEVPDVPETPIYLTPLPRLVWNR